MELSEETIGGTPIQSSEEQITKRKLERSINLSPDAKARCDLVNWVMAISKKYSFGPTITTEMITLFDLSENKVLKSRDLTMLVCFVIVSEQFISITPFQMVQICRNRFTTHQIIAATRAVKSYFDTILIKKNPCTIIAEKCNNLCVKNYISQFLSDCIKKRCYGFIALMSFLPHFNDMDWDLLSICSINLFLTDFVPSLHIDTTILYGPYYTENLIKSTTTTYINDLKDYSVALRNFQSYDEHYRLFVSRIG
ncbi:hypothetical protein QTN25_009626 [Entamoeba marina]